MAWTEHGGVVNDVGIQPLELGTVARGPVAAASTASAPGEGAPTPLVRASRAWLAMKVSPVLESLAFLARGVECGRPPRGAACPRHVLGPLVGTIVGPVGGLLPRDAVEELFRRASDVRDVTQEEWLEWRRSRFSAHLLEDVTMLAYRGSCVGRTDEARCTCSESLSAAEPLPIMWRTRVNPLLGPVPALAPDTSGRTDPWQDALVELASRYRGRGSLTSSKYSGSGRPSISDTRMLVAHLERLASAYAGPRRADRMTGLGRLDWNPPLSQTRAWRLRDRAGRTEDSREELRGRLLAAVGA